VPSFEVTVFTIGSPILAHPASLSALNRAVGF
jgi:hypothetical protein